MDTNRISIINQDLSQGSTEQTVTLKGFTVVKAEKGPIEPLLIPAGSPSMIYEVLGYTSKDYKEIQEVIDFNSNHDIYVSAPYDQTNENIAAPVAYITPAGIFASSEPVSLQSVDLGNIKDGGEDVDGINTFSADVPVLIPVGKEASIFARADNIDEDASDVLEYNSGDGVTIHLGFNISSTAGAFSNPSSSGIHVINNSPFSVNEPERVLRLDDSIDNVLGKLVFDIPGENLVTLLLKIDEGSYILTDDSDNLIAEQSLSDADVTSLIIDETDTSRGAISGTIKNYFSQSAISSIWSSDEFRKSVKVYWEALVNQDDIYGTFYPKYLSERKTSFTFPSQKLGNKISFTVSEKITPASYSTYTITGSLLDNAVDGFGSSLSFGERLSNQHLVEIEVIKPFSDNVTYTASESVMAPTLPAMQVNLSRGVRVVNDASVEAVWAGTAADPDYEHVEIFFKPNMIERDVEGAIPESEFFSLANTHKLSRFVASIQTTPEQTSSVSQLNYGHNYFISTNEFLRKSTFTKEDYWSPLIGSVAGMYLDCVIEKMGGVAPMYLNSGGLGGQLNVSVRKARYKYNKDQLTLLDNANFNPIIRDRAYGVMLVSQKTALGGELSDWSYIGHASAFLRLMREVRDGVMVPQLGKPNNPYYRELRKNQIDMLLRPRLEGLTRIWAEAISDTSKGSVNTDEVLEARSFKMVIHVKVDIFSEAVELVLINYAQGTEIGE